MSGTDMPPLRWGAIDKSALTSRMPILRYNPLTVDRIPGPPTVLAPLYEIENEPYSEASTQMGETLRQLTRKLLAEQDEAVTALRQRAEETGDQRGVRVEHRTENDGDSIRFRLTAKLSDEVPYGLVDHRWEFEPIRPLT